MYTFIYHVYLSRCVCLLSSPGKKGVCSPRSLPPLPFVRIKSISRFRECNPPLCSSLSLSVPTLPGAACVTEETTRVHQLTAHSSSFSRCVICGRWSSRLACELNVQDPTLINTFVCMSMYVLHSMVQFPSTRLSSLDLASVGRIKRDLLPCGMTTSYFVLSFLQC